MRPVNYVFRKILKGRTNFVSALGILLVILGILGFVLLHSGSPECSVENPCVVDRPM
jgi:hypothetical protein